MRVGLLPEKIDTIKLNIPKEYIKRELSKNIQLGGSTIWLFKVKGKPFAGEITGEKYDIVLKTTYRNSFKPKITLSLFEYENITEIHIAYKLELLLKIFLYIFISILSIIQGLIVYFGYDSIVNNFNSFYFFPSLLIASLLMLSRLGFFMSMGHSQGVINKLLQMARNNYWKQSSTNNAT